MFCRLRSFRNEASCTRNARPSRRKATSSGGYSTLNSDFLLPRCSELAKRRLVMIWKRSDGRCVALYQTRTLRKLRLHSIDSCKSWINLSSSKSRSLWNRNTSLRTAGWKSRWNGLPQPMSRWKLLDNQEI